jgi:NAD(P)H-dependent FMN reductase
MRILAISGSLRLASTNTALLLPMPEYAHGLPGSFKNALEAGAQHRVSRKDDDGPQSIVAIGPCA